MVAHLQENQTHASINSLLQYSNALKLAVDNTRYLTEKSYSRIHQISQALLSQLNQLSECPQLDASVVEGIHESRSKTLSNIQHIHKRLHFLNPTRVKQVKKDFAKKKVRFLASKNKAKISVKARGIATSSSVVSTMRKFTKALRREASKLV